MDKKTKYIYLLYHEYSDKCYVGQTFDLKNRYYGHLNSHKYKFGKNNIKDCWVKSLLKKKLKPKIEILQKCSEQEADFYEIFYIEFFKKIGFKLVNGSMGGNSFIGGHTEETKKKISAANKGRKMSPEHNHYLHQVVMKGRKAPLKEKLFISTRLLGNKFRLGKEPTNKGKRKLSSLQVAEIKNRLDSGELGKDLAKEFNVCASCITAIKKGIYNLPGHGYQASNDSWKLKDKAMLRQNNLYLFS